MLRTNSLVLRSALIGAMAAGTALMAGTGPASAASSASSGTSEPGMAAQFVAHINSERAGSGRPALASSGALNAVAAGWAAHMAATNELAHNPGLAGDVSGWHYLGENVGVGYSVSSLESAFWNSAEHRSNILDPHYTEVGVAVVDVNGKLWVAEEFEQPMSGGSTHHGEVSATTRHATASPVHPAAVRWMVPAIELTHAM